MQRQRNLVLILARDLADKLASAVVVFDSEGTLVYFNEHAEQILGKPYSEAGAMKLEEWTRTFQPTGPGGEELTADELPLFRALGRQEPVHRSLRINAVDGIERDIQVTALPLYATREDLVGVMALFWEHDGAPPSPGAG